MAEETITQFARRLGVHHRAVQKALANRVKSWRRDENGRVWIDAEKAVEEWARNTDPVEAAKNGKFWVTPQAYIGEPPATAKTIDDLSDMAAAAVQALPVALEALPMAPSTSAPEETDYQAARTSRERANAELAHLELQKQLGVLVSKSEVEKASFTVGRVLRDGFMTLPDRMAPRLAAESDMARIHADLENEIRYILNGLSDRLPAASAQGS